MRNPLVPVKLALAVLRLVRDPNRLDVVFSLSDALVDDPRASALFDETNRRPEVAPACAARLRTPRLDLDALAKLPDGSFGRAAETFFRTNGLDPDALPRRDATTDVEWLNAHLYETHDLWHVATGFSPDVAGELGLQAFYAAQLGGPFPLLILVAGLLNTVIFAPLETRVRLAAIARGWTMGANARLFIGLDWAALLPMPMSDVKARLALEGPEGPRANSNVPVKELLPSPV
ncbi:MAG: Coq4 family protein [Polyangiaceae bacterium]